MNNSLPTISITKMMYGWSKWGGGRMGMAKETLDEWYCQICGDKQTGMLPSYMIPMDENKREWARVCADCKAKAKRINATYYWHIVSIVKGVC